ncbi:MAG: glycosyltransferase family 39 protein, partial [Candidatus Omnitrophica bacterium]|nr:glycosyltransferase family 39 protein [Candidatus Omnitrophota bacterium]
MEYLASIFIFMSLVLILWAVGRKMLTICSINCTSVSENFVFSFGIGFGIIAYLVLFLGIFKVLYCSLICGVLAAIALIVFPEVKKCLRDIKDAFIKIKNTKLDPVSKVLLCMLGVVVLMTLFGALSPSYSNDSMVYHLTDAKYFAQNHMVGHIFENSTNSLWPYLVEMYYTLAMLFNLAPMAGLFHFSLAVVSAVGIYSFSKRFFSHKIGIVSSVIFFLTPIIFTEATHTYVDLGSVFYAFLAFYAFVLYLENKTINWAGISGVMCGLGMSVKYFFVIVPVILGIYFVFVAFRDKFPGSVFKALLLFSAGTIAIPIIWYVRQYIVIGTPVFPFFAGIFGVAGLDPEVIKVISEKSIRESHGMIVNLKSLLTLPWRMVMSPEEFGGEKIGPVFLAIIPAFIFLKDVDKIVKRVSIFAIAYICLWFVLYQHMRFFMPVVPFLSVISAYIICDTIGTKKVIDRIIWTLVCILLAFSLGFSFYHNVEPAKVVLGMESRENYLSENERSFRISEYVNKQLSTDDKLMVVGEGHTFFVDKSYKREMYWWIFSRYEKKYNSPDEVVDALRRDGFSHILYAEYGGDKEKRGTFFRLTKLMENEEFKDGFLEEIYTEESLS